jgi:hypothetical protein
MFVVLEVQAFLTSTTALTTLTGYG